MKSPLSGASAVNTEITKDRKDEFGLKNRKRSLGESSGQEKGRSFRCAVHRKIFE